MTAILGFTAIFPSTIWFVKFHQVMTMIYIVNVVLKKIIIHGVDGCNFISNLHYGCNAKPSLTHKYLKN